MASHHGKEGAVYVSSTVVGEVTSWEYSENARLQEDSAITDSAATYMAGITDGGGSIDCFWDPADSGGQDQLREGDTVTLNLYPTGDDSGEVKFSGSAVVEEMRVTGSRDSMITATFTFKGVLTESTIPS